MKEFIEKLIGRLEEKENEAVLKAPNTSDISNIEYQKWMMKSYGFKESIEIVNQLAEEHKNGSTDTSTNTSIGWIPCSEKMPLFIDNVLVCTKSGGRTIACLTTGKRFCDMYMNIIDNVVAWMPLPPAYVPKEGRE